MTPQVIKATCPPIFLLRRRHLLLRRRDAAAATAAAVAPGGVGGDKPVTEVLEAFATEATVADTGRGVAIVTTS